MKLEEIGPLIFSLLIHCKSLVPFNSTAISTLIYRTIIICFHWFSLLMNTQSFNFNLIQAMKLQNQLSEQVVEGHNEHSDDNLGFTILASFVYDRL